MRRAWEKLVVFCEMIKVSHTVFALPFAVGATFLASGGTPDPAVLGKIILAVVCARTAAMAFNRLVDRRIDAENPRTEGRALVTGDLSTIFVWLATGAALTGFFLVSAWINPLALKLSPVAAAVILGYSLTKRFTRLCHVFLGAALALAPVGAWVAVRGTLSWEPWILGLAVLLWTAGFDIIYACMDSTFDRQRGLHSIPATLGVERALLVSALLHAGMVLALGVLWWVLPTLGPIFLGTLAVIGALLVYEHRIVSADDLSRVNRSFLTMNGLISFTLMGAMILEVVLPW